MSERLPLAGPVVEGRAAQMIVAGSGNVFPQRGEVLRRELGYS
jgi:hypothetical protein